MRRLRPCASETFKKTVYAWFDNMPLNGTLVVTPSQSDPWLLGDLALSRGLANAYRLAARYPSTGLEEFPRHRSGIRPRSTGERNRP